jgi:hypothetical protein
MKHLQTCTPDRPHNQSALLLLGSQVGNVSRWAAVRLDQLPPVEAAQLLLVD